MPTLPYPSPAVLEAYMRAHGFKYWTIGHYNVNLIGIRHPDRTGDAFDDAIGLHYIRHDGQWVHRWFAATTDPGLFFLRGGSSANPANPNGTAMLVHGRQYRRCWRIGLHKGRPALVQVEDMAFVRDADRDDVRDYEEIVAAGKAFTGKIGCNLHNARRDYVVEDVGPFSAACQVIPDTADHDDLMRVANLQRQVLGSSLFSYTLLPWEAFAGT